MTWLKNVLGAESQVKSELRNTRVCLFKMLQVLFYYFSFLKKLFLIRGSLFYNIVLVPEIHQHESAIGMHMSPPSWPSFPPHSRPPDCHRAAGWAPCVIRSFPLATYFIYGNVYISISVLLSQFVPPCPAPALSISPLSMSESLFLPCE